MYCIETKDLTMNFKNNRVLNRINLKVRSKGCTGYLGPNGSGKTTTMKILTNLLRPKNGQAYLYGINVQKNPREALKRVGAIIDVPMLYPFFTARQNLDFLGKLKGIKKNHLKERIKNVLITVDLLKKIDVKVGKYSTGMKQRLAIAQALLGDPDLLILDEPTFGLDPKGMADIRELLAEIKKERPIFLSSHLLHEIGVLCDDVILINNGRIIKQDSLKNIQSLFKPDKIEIELTEQISDKKIQEINEIEYIQSVKSKEYILSINFQKEKIKPNEILKKLVKLNIEMNSFNPVQMNLESFYLQEMEGGKIERK
ncbi:MAG: ABC transporter ATP-binding protein [Candidatus Lokiarchaeota archaeon]|nr:ABC transporter ATP-binding protein [Candidatus Lokiarchaeota archaeon]